MRTFRAGRFARSANALFARVVRLGLAPGPWALLTVPGRKSGLPRTTPIAFVRAGNGYRVMSPYGRVDWVKNVRAAGRAQLTRRGRTFDVVAEELPSNEAAKVLRGNLTRAPRLLRRVFKPYFDTPYDAPLVDWEREAAHHPVFHFEPLPDTAEVTVGADSGRQAHQPGPGVR